MKTCENCKYFWCDNSVGYYECYRFDDMTDEQIETHFSNNKPNCPCFEELIEPDYPIECYYPDHCADEN